MHSVFLVEAHLMGAYIEYKYDGTRESVYCVEKRKYFGFLFLCGLNAGFLWVLRMSSISFYFTFYVVFITALRFLLLRSIIKFYYKTRLLQE